ncbi:MAG: LPS export ABC transporter periplasmic protein LptC [Desulfuromonadales bacterium]|jgi:LPS export ABC transporter protein LptC
MSYFRPRNLLLVLALILAAVLTIVIVLRYQPASQLETIVKALPKGVDIALQDIDYTHMEQGQARWRLIARQVEHQAATKTLVVSAPRLNFFDEKGDISGSLQAGGGLVTDDYRKVILHDEVVLNNAPDYTVHAARLVYDQDQQTITTEGFVRLEAGGMHLEGQGMTLFIQDQRLIFDGQVKARFSAPAKG